MNIANQVEALIEAKAGDPDAMKLWNHVKGDLKKSRDKTRSFIRNLEKLEERTLAIRDAIKKMGKDRKSKGGLDGMDSGEVNKALKNLNATLNKLYGEFAEGRNAMDQVAKAARISTTRAGKPKGARSKSVAAAAMSRGRMMQDLERYTKDLNKRIVGLAEVGSRSLRLADGMLKRKSEWTSEMGLINQLSSWVNDMVDFKNQFSGVFFGAMRGIKKRVDELVLRQGKQPIGRFPRGMMKMVSDFDGYAAEELPFLVEDEEFAYILDALVLGDDEAGSWLAMAEDVLGVDADVVEEGVPSDPKARAELRMNDAAKRGGVSGLVKALQRRLKATKDEAKILGMMSAIDDLVSELQVIRKQAQAKT